MSIDRLETLRSIVPAGEGVYGLHIIRPDGRNKYFTGIPLVKHEDDKALVIVEKPGKKERILRLVRVTDPKLAQEIDQHALFKKMPPVVIRLTSFF